MLAVPLPAAKLLVILVMVSGALSHDGGLPAVAVAAKFSACTFLLGEVVTRNGVEYYALQNSLDKDPEDEPTYWRPLPWIIYWNVFETRDYTVLPGCATP